MELPGRHDREDLDVAVVWCVLWLWLQLHLLQQRGLGGALTGQGVGGEAGGAGVTGERQHGEGAGR